MTNRMMEGFDWLPAGDPVTPLSMAGWYNAGSASFELVTANTAFGYGKALQAQGIPVPTRHLVYPIGAQVEGFYGLRVHIGHAHAGAALVTFYDMVNAGTQFSVSFHPFGIIRVWRGFMTTLLATSEPGAFYTDAWFWLEVGGVCDPAAGAVEVRVNTVPKITLALANTRATARTAFDAVGFGHGAGTTLDFRFDDLYFNDPAGAVNNTFLGNSRVKALFTAGDGDSTDFAIGGTAPAASKWQSLLNTSLNDAQFLFSTTNGHKSLSTITPIINAPLVHALQLGGSMRQDDATQRVARNLLKSGGVLVTGADNALDQSWTVYRDTIEIDPATGVQFTGAGANAIQIGAELVS